MRNDLESKIIAELIKNSNLMTMYKDKINSKLFCDMNLDIFEFIYKSVSNNLSVDRYILTNKFGGVIDGLLNDNLAKCDFIEFEKILNQLITLSTSEVFADLCSNYLSDYHSGEVIDNDKFILKLTQNLVTHDDIKTFTNKDAIDYLLEELNNQNPLGEISLGYGLDETLQGGGNRGEVMFVSGRAKMFKTSFVMNLFNHMTIKNSGVFFSLEMSAKELWKKQYGMIEGQSFNEHKKTGRSFNAYGDFSLLTKKNAFIIDYPDISIFTIHKLIKMHKLKHSKLDFIIVDHLNIIQKSKGKLEYEAITEITRQLKVIAKEENIFIICLTQLNRSMADRKDKRPQLSDLRGSGSIEQDADFVVMLHREEYYYAETGKIAPEYIKNILEVNFSAARRGQQNLYIYRVNLPLGKMEHSLSEYERVNYLNALKESSSSNGKKISSF